MSMLESLHQLVCTLLAGVAISTYGGKPDDGKDDTAALLKAIAAADEVTFASGQYDFYGPLVLDQAKAANVRLAGKSFGWTWQHWAENRVKPKTVLRITGLGNGTWWTQDAKRRGPVVCENLAFSVESGSVFLLGDFTSTDWQGCDARGNAFRFCEFVHDRLYDPSGSAFIRGIRQYNFEIDHCSFRGATYGVEISGDQPTLRHLRLGHQEVGIRTWLEHVPAVIEDVEIEGVTGTGVAVLGDRLHQVSVETGYPAFGPGRTAGVALLPPGVTWKIVGEWCELSIACNDWRIRPGRVVRFGDLPPVLVTETERTRFRWFSCDDKCPPRHVDPAGPLVRLDGVPAFLGGNRASASQCRFEVNTEKAPGIPSLVVTPSHDPIRVYAVHEAWGLGRETFNRPEVGAWCAGRQWTLYGQILTDHQQLLPHPLASHPLATEPRQFDANWGGDVGAANGEAGHLRYRVRDGRWVRRLSDSPTGWTIRKTAGVLSGRAWADGERTMTVWDGRRQQRVMLSGGWSEFAVAVEPNGGRASIGGVGIEVETVR